MSNAKTLPGSAYLGEIVVHGEDLRRAVGTTGSGPEVEGSLAMLIMATCGRGFAVDELKGAGTDQLAARL